MPDLLTLLEEVVDAHINPHAFTSRDLKAAIRTALGVIDEHDVARLEPKVCESEMTEIPMPQESPYRPGPYLVINGHKIDAFATEAEAEAWRGHLQAVNNSYGGVKEKPWVAAMPDLSKLELSLKTRVTHD